MILLKLEYEFESHIPYYGCSIILSSIFYALVRSRARSKAKKLGMNKCVICGYDKQ